MGGGKNVVGGRKQANRDTWSFFLRISERYPITRERYFWGKAQLVEKRVLNQKSIVPNHLARITLVLFVYLSARRRRIHWRPGLVNKRVLLCGGSSQFYTLSTHFLLSTVRFSHLSKPPHIVLFIHHPKDFLWTFSYVRMWALFSRVDVLVLFCPASVEGEETRRKLDKIWGEFGKIMGRKVSTISFQQKMQENFSAGQKSIETIIPDGRLFCC